MSRISWPAYPRDKTSQLKLTVVDRTEKIFFTKLSTMSGKLRKSKTKTKQWT
jgi:hypothetical protein